MCYESVEKVNQLRSDDYHSTVFSSVSGDIIMYFYFFESHRQLTVEIENSKFPINVVFIAENSRRLHVNVNYHRHFTVRVKKELLC